MQNEKNNFAFLKHYNRLNDEQRETVDATDGPLLVLAGPGTGKTQLLSVRAANIILRNKAKAENILILTFSNAAAGAMRDRLAQIVGSAGYSVEVETFHSFANSIILESEEALKYTKDRVELSDVERLRAMEYVLDNTPGLKNLRLFGAPYYFRSEIEKRISELKKEALDPREFKEKLKTIDLSDSALEEKHILRLGELGLIYEQYEKLKNEDCQILFDKRGRRDYDDMILVALKVLRAEEKLRDLFYEQYKYVMVDEFQDTNGSQFELLLSILDGAKNNVCCVGDDDQSIYRFQGASLSNFKLLKERLPKLKTIELKANYRSSSGILKTARSIIDQIPPKERVAVKKLESKKEYAFSEIKFVEFGTPEEELEFLVSRIKSQAEVIRKDVSLSAEEREKPFNNIAVLLRKRNDILRVVDAFLRAGLPYATDGKEDIRAEKRVRQMLDVLALAGFNVEDTSKATLSLYKILSADYIGAAHSDVVKLLEYVNQKKQSARRSGEKHCGSFFQEFQNSFPASGETAPQETDSEKLKISTTLQLKDPHALHKAAWAIDRLSQDARVRPVHDLVMRYISDTGLYKHILDTYEKDRVLRMRDLRSLSSFVNRIKESDLADPALGLDKFTEELSLMEEHSMALKGELVTMSQDGVRVYTAHASKGLEFHTVFVPFCLEKKSWPKLAKGDSIPLPAEILKSKEKYEDKNERKLLTLYDETRLFYVVSTRAKASIFYTAAPEKKARISQFFDQMDIDRESVPACEEKLLSSFLSSVKARDTFQDASDVLSDIVKGLTLNPTSLNNYISCRRKFLYDNVLRLPAGKNQHLVFGNSAHKALEEVYSIYMKTGNFPDFKVFEKEFRTELEYQGVTESIKRLCLDRLGGALRKWYEKEARFPIMPLGLENKLEISLPGGVPFKGTFDKIEKEPDGTLRVIDYKTGRPDKHIKAIANCRDVSSGDCDDYYRQLIAYKMLYELTRGHPEKISKGVLKFLEPVKASVKKYDLEKGEFRDEDVELTDQMVESLKNVIVSVWGNIQELKFDKLPKRDGKERCARCDYDSICWE
ncbi:MAG: ATP-dependent helicase [Candidatus Omnitrophica bacterium]|nr:ATP-dependent helicase [Candidatus Omnitrophota bacterium]